MKTCGGCGKSVADKDYEHCWFCPALLCFDCWEDVGHCGHAEAEAINAAALIAGRKIQADLTSPFVRGRVAAHRIGGKDDGSVLPGRRHEATCDLMGAYRGDGK